MNPAVADKLEAIKALCVKHRVAALYLFGSATGGEFDPGRSDVDFVVRFLPGTTGGFNHPYFKLHEELEALLGRRVDLVSAEAIRNPYFRESVEATKVPVYAAA